MASSEFIRKDVLKKINLQQKNLAINGGSPVRTAPWIDNLTIDTREKDAIFSVLESGYLSLFEGSHNPDPPFSFKGGPQVQALEAEWSEYYEIKHSIAMNSATSGLYAAIGALSIGYGDEVIVSPYTMSACAMAPLIYGAIPVFADIDPKTGCLSAESISQKISPRTKAILIVHQFGFVADMDKIMQLAAAHNLSVIEDCAQAHGAKYKEKFVGTIGDIGVFSLNVNKTIQTGEGGICITNNNELAYRLQLIRNHGEAVVGPAGYKNILNIAGFNFRMTEIIASIARVQLSKLDKLNDQRLSLVGELKLRLEKFDFISPLSGCDSCGFCMPKAKCKNTYYVFPVRYDSKIAGVSRDEFSRALNAEGVNFYQGYVRPLYLQPVYQNKSLFKFGYPFSARENEDCQQNYDQGICPIAEKFHFEEVLINEHIRPPNTIDDIQQIFLAIDKVASS